MKFLLTLNALVFILVVPLLEWNTTHVFNPDWPKHARLHEVWQLSTNFSLGLFVIWLVWFGKQLVIPAWISLFVSGGFTFAYLIRSHYDGSMQHTSGYEITIMGFNPAVALVLFLSGCICLYLLKATRDKHLGGNK